ncbi:hypothetical protein L1987_68901 [Smallanthus sonchifolius]|uniref:Uncharacterized protein n=1 Tax=Smallanthus sonchifolius TaxID=185202 RepID=A0ACB9B600_9ASTR|nr:hypothetical protein L1987_68901 [Smallanthus sonchifolius]
MTNNSLHLCESETDEEGGFRRHDADWWFQASSDGGGKRLYQSIMELRNESDADGGYRQSDTEMVPGGGGRRWGEILAADNGDDGGGSRRRKERV